jgi:uncharacterized ferritin-like protein (DUF455 family)
MTIQVREFAERVLFGTSIEAKLGFPREALIDTRPGDAIVTPRRLTRPKHLMLRDDGVRAKPPSQAKLVDEKERGKLLHFFGNHELLATELMALALLKFPDAPASFRRGLLETLKDEQMHTRLYMHRMEQCGIEFGELPLNEYFWKSVSSMEDPLDYVTRLSLTFEQANLDYAREYGQIFDGVGDSATAKVLNKIYRDEIDHVGFGLKWFRRWKASGKTDWEAFRERLVFPLSPARAKGNDFNAEGRREVGLDQNFINDLEIFQQSRGRTPNVLWFNPNAEACAAENRDVVSSKAAAQLQDDLAFLPAYVSRQDDVLILSQRMSPEFLSTIQSYGFPLPEMHEPVAATNGRGPRAPDLNRKLGDLRPWAWSPDSCRFFEDNLQRVTRSRPPDALWNDRLRALFGKTWSARWGQSLAAACRSVEWIAPDSVYGHAVQNLDELREARRHFADLGHTDIVCKAPFATAAQGNRCLLTGETLSPTLRTWLETVWAHQGSLVVEPWLDRVFDFSIQYEMSGDGLKQVGITRMLNNPRGQFRGIITNAFCKDLDPKLVRFIMDRSDGPPRLFHHYETTVAPRLEAALKAASFRGPVGIDAFIYRNRAGALRLKTIVEINPRFTMGRVAHELGQHNAPHAVGCLQILTKSQVRKTNTPLFSDWAKRIREAHPVQLTDHPKPLLRSGSFPLTDPETAKQFLAVYHVRKSIHDLPLGGVKSDKSVASTFD